MSILRCSHCGTANREGSNFCNRCGTALHEQAEQLSEEIGAPDRPIPPESDPAAGLGVESAEDAAPGAQTDPGWTRPRSAVERDPEASATTPIDATLDAAASYQPPPQPPQQTTSSWRGTGNPASGAPAQREDEWPEELVSDDDFVESAYRVPTRRLVTGVQGLLDPIRLAGTVDPEALAHSTLNFPPRLTVPAEQLRRIRTLVTEDPVLIEHPRRPSLLPPTRFRLPWLILLLLLAVGLPLLFGIERPIGKARLWPGVADAHAAISTLSGENTVQILWAYDPATAGELDLVMRPVVAHLMEQGVRVQIVSLLPTGLATARRLWNDVLEELTTERPAVVRPDRIAYWEGGFLPGGAPALALLAHAPVVALAGHTPQATLGFSLGSPALTIVAAAQAEDVQQWLELVQPVTVTPVVAVTSAGADPLLRPYLASGQLTGLVSGFDGAASYHELRNQRLSQTAATRLRQQLVAQNWGHIALIGVLILGNLSALWLGQRSMGERADGGQPDRRQREEENRG